MVDLNNIDYSENLFEAIDTIIASRLKQLSYDTTVTATIVGTTQAQLGKYRVTENNNYIYTAISTYPYYTKGEQVYVLHTTNGAHLILGSMNKGTYVASANLSNIHISLDLNNYLSKNDIADWAKAPTKPTYTAHEIGAMSPIEVQQAISNAIVNQIDLNSYLQKNDLADWAKANTKPTYTAHEVGATNTQDVEQLIADSIADIISFNIKLVETLPQSNISTTTIYLIPNELIEDTYTQYVYINNEWINIGTTQANLQNYLQKNELADWAKAPTKPTYTAKEVGALSESVTIPAAQVQSDWNAIDGMGVILNKPTIPNVPAWALESSKPSYTADEIIVEENMNLGTKLSGIDLELLNTNTKFSQSLLLADVQDLPNRTTTQSIFADLNTVIVPGVYQILQINARQILNIPHKNGGTLRVWNLKGEDTTSNHNIAQEFIDQDENFWYRTRQYKYNENQEKYEWKWSKWKNLRSTRANKQNGSPSIRPLVYASGFDNTLFADGYWHITFIDNTMIMASLNLISYKFTQDDTCIGTGAILSPFLYLSLPFPMTDICLTGVGSAYGISIVNVNQDGYAGVKFRLSALSTSANNQHIDIRLSLIGALAATPEKPGPSSDGYNWGNGDNESAYLGCNGISSTSSDNPINIIKTYLGQETPPQQFIYDSDNWHNRPSDEYNSVNITNTENPNIKVGKIVCDTFVELILRGIDYTNSPYNRIDSGGKFNLADLPVNVNGIEWVDTLNKWTIGKASPKTYETEDGQVNPVQNEYFNIYFSGKNAHYTYDYAWVLWQKKLIFSDVNQVRSGDLAFWTEHHENKYFDGVTHIGIITIEENNVKYLNEVTYYNYIVNGESGSILRKIPLAEKVPQPDYFGRIDYRASYPQE